MYRLIFVLAICLIVVGRTMVAQTSKAVVSNVVREAGRSPRRRNRSRAFLSNPRRIQGRLNPSFRPQK